jgi:hypothetical protein
MSIVVMAAQEHSQRKHSALKQTDLITFHVEFLARSAVAPAEIFIYELKMGRQFSTVRAQLFQYLNGDSSAEPRICMEALLTLGNLMHESQNSGESLSTRPLLAAASMPPRKDCKEWEYAPEWPQQRPAAFKINILLPAGSGELMYHPTLGPSVREQWVQWRDSVGDNSEGFQISALAYLADAFRPLPEAYRLKGNWYPTLSYGLEVKKAPPTEKGWEWLFLRIETMQVKNGRFDLDVVILDEDGDLVALSKHTALIVKATRNSKAIETKL